MEQWKSIKGYEGIYEISNYGNVKSLSRIWIGKTKKGEDRVNKTKEKLLKQYIQKGKRSNIKDTACVLLRANGKNKHYFVHRLVALHFIDNENPTERTQVNHIDGNRLNNNYTNLEWCTAKENVAHAFENNLIKTQKKVLQIDKETLEVIQEYSGESEACRYVGVTQGKISRAIKRNGTCKGYVWKWK